MILRSDFIRGLATFEEYYSQFVTPRFLEYLDQKLGDEIRASSDPDNFNDIPMIKFDHLSHSWLDITNAIKLVSGWAPSFSDWTCLYKVAARKIYQAQFNNQDNQS